VNPTATGYVIGPGVDYAGTAANRRVNVRGEGHKTAPSAAHERGRAGGTVSCRGLGSTRVAAASVLAAQSLARSARLIQHTYLLGRPPPPPGAPATREASPGRRRARPRRAGSARLARGASGSGRASGAAQSRAGAGALQGPRPRRTPLDSRGGRARAGSAAWRAARRRLRARGKTAPTTPGCPTASARAPRVRRRGAAARRGRADARWGAGGRGGRRARAWPTSGEEAPALEPLDPRASEERSERPEPGRAAPAPAPRANTSRPEADRESSRPDDAADS